MSTDAPVVRCVGAVAHDEAGRLLVVRRAHDPSAGLWSVPGGKVEPGEDDAQAVRREAAEETGLVVQAGRLLGAVDVPGAGVLFRVHDYSCRAVGGTLRPGSDALDARFVTRRELLRLPVVPGLVEALAGWDALPR